MSRFASQLSGLVTVAFFVFITWGELGGLYHSAKGHGPGDFVVSLVFPPWSWYRSVEFFWHDGGESVSAGDQDLSDLEDGPTWIAPSGSVAVTYPEGWEEMPNRRTKEYSENTPEPIPGSIFGKQTKGGFQSRGISSRVYDFGQLQRGTSLRSMTQLMEEQLSKKYEVVDSGHQENVGFIVYRFVHSRDSVTQGTILFAGRDNSIYFLEITGHRDDEQEITRTIRYVYDRIES